MTKFGMAANAVQQFHHTVGATIRKGEAFRLLDNGPWLRPVGVDTLGRLWREDADSLTCIFDPRPNT